MSGAARRVGSTAHAPQHGGVWADPADSRRVGIVPRSSGPGATARAAAGAPANAVPVTAVLAGSHGAVLSGAVNPSTPQYPVLLLNEEQVAQLLQRQAMRTITPGASSSLAFTAYVRLMRRARIVMAALLLIGAGAGAWAWAPLPVLSAFPWTGADAPPPVATGASFSLTVASPRSADAARDLERRLEVAGTPAFVRSARSTHHVMAGPYVSLDEAETEQRRLSLAGFGGSRVFVDDSLRKTSRDTAAVVAGSPALVLVAAAHQLSLVFEFEREPQQVTTKRSADGTVLVEMGPVDGAVEPQAWSAPAGVDLLRQVKVEEIVGAPESRLARATLTMPRSTMAQARVEGRRVYVDLAPAPRTVAPASKAAPAVRRAAPTVAAPRAEPLAPAATPASTPAAAPTSVADASQSSRPGGAELLRPVLARAERLVPFLQSAARTGGDVLRAIASNVNDVEAALRQVPSTPEIADAHSALTSALASARRAVDTGFTGDRVAEAHQAASFVEAAKSVLPAAAATLTPAP